MSDDENDRTNMAEHSDDEDDHDSGVIRPIEEESVQRIVAGQAVTDLASAAKELVDNALDAGSTSINSKFLLVRASGTKKSAFLLR